MQDWHTFHGYLTACMKGTKFDARAEADFLQLKSQIALLHDAFLESIDSGSREVAATSQSVITIVERCILLRQMIKMTPAELKKMEMEWHEAYLLINETIGILEDQISKYAAVGQTQHLLDVYGWKNIKRVTSFLTGKAFVGTVVGLVLLIALVVLPLFKVYSYDQLDTISATQAPYRVVRNLLRTAFPNMLYLDWDDYVNCNVKKDAKFSEDKADPNRRKEFVDLLTANGTLTNVSKAKGVPADGDLKRFVNGGNPYDTFVVMFADAQSAQDAMKLVEERKKGNYNGLSGVVGFDVKYQVDRSANVVAVASPPTTSNSPLVPEALRLVMQKH